MQISIQSNDFLTLRNTLERVSKNIDKELYTISSKVGTKAKSELGKAVTSEIAIKLKDVRKDITIQKVKPIGVRVTLHKKNRFSLKRFNPRQNSQGVTYKIEKTGGRKLIKGAFMGPNPSVTSVRLYGHVWERKGKARLPIRKKKGPSAAGVLSKHPSRVRAVVRLLGAETKKQLERRIKFRLLKIAGTI